VVGPDGDPIGSVEVSWTTLGSRTSALSLHWPRADRDTWIASTTLAITDDSGRFTLAEPPGAGSEPSVVWLTHPSHRATFWKVDPAARLGSLPPILALARAEPISVRVVLTDGGSAPGALVLQRLRLGYRERSSLQPFELQASFALQRRSVVDAEGRVIVPDFGGRMILSAEHYSGTSPAWIGAAPDSIELRLGPSFSWSARVSAESADIAQLLARVDVFCSTGSQREFVDSATIEGLGSLDPRTAAWMAADRYVFELDGGGIPQHVEIDAPQPGAHVEVEFRLANGCRFPVRVTDSAGSPLEDAKVQWAWNRDQRWQYATRQSDAAGVAVLEHSPLGVVWLVVNRTGFVQYRRNLEVSGDFEGTFDVALSPGASLTGVVRSAGKPVTEFTIMHRPASTATGTRIVDFDDRKDGTFSLEGVPLEETVVFAVSPDRPRSKGQIIDLRNAETKPLEFDLSPGAAARGLVRDARSSEPIAGAEVQVWTSDVDTRMRPFGPLARSDDQGRFRVEGLALGEPSSVEVRHPGRATAWIRRRAEQIDELDLGLITLEEPASIQVELKLSPGLDPGSWFVELTDTPEVEAQKFSPAGLVRFDGIDPGGYFVNVWSADAISFSETCVARAGEVANVVLDLMQGRTLDVEIVWDSDSPVLTDRSVAVQSFDRGYTSPSVQFAPAPATGLVRFSSVTGDRVRISVNDHLGTCLGSIIPTLEDLRSGRVVVRIGGPPRVVRVVNGQGTSVSGVQTSLRSTNSGWFAWRNTDSDGRASFGALSEEVYDVALLVPPRGGGVVRRVAFSEGVGEVVFEPTAQLSIRLLDGEEPLTGVSVGIRDGFGLDMHFGFVTTDVEGRTEYEGCLQQAFKCQVQQSGLWPTDFLAEATTSGTETTAQVRRLGSVVLHAKRGGLALAGVVLRVESEEFATSVDPWIADGRVSVSDTRGATDDQGRLRLDGLPRGTYRWSITLDEGATIGGRFDVEPHRRVDVDVLVP